MACSGYLENPDAGSYNWCQSTRLRLSVQRSVRMARNMGVTFAEAGRFPFTPLCGHQ